MIDSMTGDELDGKVAIQKEPSRIVRIARGSGTSVREVTELLEENKKMSLMIEKFKKGGLGKNMPANLMNRNPN